MDGLFPLIFHGQRSELREKYGLAQLVDFAKNHERTKNIKNF